LLRHALDLLARARDDAEFSEERVNRQRGGGQAERATTHLNACAILSQLHRHSEAMEHAKVIQTHT
jgi:hypothetical protein